MSAFTRARTGLSTILADPVGRRAYVARLKWLLRGSGDLPAHSLEYRAGLTGRWAIPAVRSHPDGEAVLHCPEDCGAHAPLSHLYERRFVYRLNRTVGSTASGATIMCGAEEPPFFVRESITWPFESILSHGLDVPEITEAGRPIPGVSAIFPTTTNYYHWLIEDLPSVLRAATAAPEATFLAFRDGMTPRHQVVAQVLELDLQPAPLIVAMDEQVLPGRADGSWFVHPEDARLLADLGRRITGRDTSHGSDRLYVSRRGTKRPLPDEERIERLLADRGFKILRLEDMPWPEQIAAFQNARLVVAPHGAGLSNLVFCPPGATVVELTFGLHYNRCFEWLCHVVGHDYRKVDADAVTGELTERLLAQLP